MSDEAPILPSYQPPVGSPPITPLYPQGLQLPDSKFHKPLYKLMKFMLKPRTKMPRTKVSKVKTGQRKGKKLKFY